MNKKISNISPKKFVFWAGLTICLLAGLLRLYNIRDTIIFLGDEGRDALAVKRIVLDLKPTLLGPTASVGGFYLGPIYYYMIAPFMIAFGMDPVGAAVMIACLGTLTVGVLFIFLYKIYGLYPAVIASVLYATAPGVIAFSRSSWNPNPTPFFALSLVICMYMTIARKKWLYSLLAGVCFGVLFQLHYLNLILAPVMLVLTLILIDHKNWLKSTIAQFIGYLIGSSMFWAFELRHGFLNTKAVIEFITRSGGAAGFRSSNPLWLFVEVNRFNIESVLGQWSRSGTQWLAILLTLIVISTLLKQKIWRKNPASKVIVLYWLVTTTGLAFYKGQWHFHYFEMFFPAPFLLLGLVLSYVTHKLPRLLFGMVAFIAVGVFLVKAPTWQQGSKLLDQTKNISTEIIKLSNQQAFNFALITNGNSDHAYRFFLEIEHHKPTPIDEKIEEQLLIVCEKYPPETCAPLGNPLWEISGFGRAEIDFQTTVFPNITLYRLKHHPESIGLIGKPAPRN